jgi:prepilin-type processing-associated H-X9-DG protein
LLFTDPNLLADFGNPNADADVVDFLTDPEACPTPVYKWYQDYANEYGFDGVTDDYLTMTDLKIIGDTEISVLNKSSVGLKINAVFADGHVENVSSIAQITVDNPDVVNVVRGRIFTLKDGQATLNVSYTDKKGTTKKLTLKVTSTTFPLTNELFNPTIWENGTFDETTKTLKTGQWGFGGWQYDGIDLSEYKYIVAKLGSENNAEVAFNVYDGNSYWGSPASYKFGNNRQVVVVLNQAIKNDGTMLNPEHIYIAGFWSNGSNPFVIDTVFLSNSSEFDPPLVFAKDLSGNEIEMLNDFIYVKGNGPSACQSFTVSGDILTDNIVVKAPSRFEISLDSSQTFTSTLTIEQNNNQVLETTVFVRMKSELKRNEYNGEVSISSTGAFSKMIMLTGNVVWPTGVNNLINPATSVLSEQYYTLTGQKINNVDNMNGIFIVKSILSDGRIVTSKVFKHK